MVLLDVVDNAWKDHLLAMDYLKSAVGQRGMAQLDPKVEYKREGMRLFEGLWRSIGERVTDLIYRMEHLSPGFVSDTFVRTNNQAEHQAYNPSDLVREQQAAIDASSGRRTPGGQTDSQPPRQGGPQRSLPLWQWQEVQAMLHPQTGSRLNRFPNPVTGNPGRVWANQRDHTGTTG